MKYVLLLLALPAMLSAQYNGGIGRGDFASAIVGNTETNIFSENDQMPVDNGLGQNYPNPFNPTTTINYRLAQSGHVTLTVFDVLGREVMKLVNGVEDVGNHTVQLNGTRLASGMYIYKIKAGSFTSVKKMMFLK